MVDTPSSWYPLRQAKVTVSPIVTPPSVATMWDVRFTEGHWSVERNKRVNGRTLVCRKELKG